MQVLTNQLCPCFTTGDKIAGDIVFLEGQVHKAIAFGCSLHKQASMFSHGHQKFSDFFLDFGAWVICIPIQIVQVCPCLTEHFIDLSLCRNPGRFVDMQPVGKRAQQWSQILLLHEGRLWYARSRAPGTSQRICCEFVEFNPLLWELGTGMMDECKSTQE